MRSSEPRKRGAAGPDGPRKAQDAPQPGSESTAHPARHGAAGGDVAAPVALAAPESVVTRVAVRRRRSAAGGSQEQPPGCVTEGREAAPRRAAGPAGPSSLAGVDRRSGRGGAGAPGDGAAGHCAGHEAYRPSVRRRVLRRGRRRRAPRRRGGWLAYRRPCRRDAVRGSCEAIESRARQGAWLRARRGVGHLAMRAGAGAARGGGFRVARRGVAGGSCCRAHRLEGLRSAAAVRQGAGSARLGGGQSSAARSDAATTPPTAHAACPRRA